MVEVEQEIQEVESWDPGGGGKIEPGIYEAKIVSVEVQSSQTGHPKLNFKYQVIDGLSTGCFAFGDRSLHPNALPYFRGMLDVLNCFATGKSFDEQKLAGRYLKIQVVEYEKQNHEKGMKVDKLFKSDINVNDQLDITAVKGGTHGPSKPQNSAGAGKGNGANRQPVAASGGKLDDLPFAWVLPFILLGGSIAAQVVHAL